MSTKNKQLAREYPKLIERVAEVTLAIRELYTKTTPQQWADEFGVPRQTIEYHIKKKKEKQA